MPRYANSSGQSNVVSWEEGEDWIEVTFESGRFTKYLYTAASCGAANVERMKALARAGRGLNSFITTTIRGAYASKS